MLKFVATLAVIGVVSSNPTCPPACPASWVPICGSDGKTYPNACTFECEQTVNRNLIKKADGECPTPTTEKPEPTCACTRELRPVCGNDFKTYNNKCLLECAQSVNKRLQKSYDGPCTDQPQPEPQPEVCICTLNYAPVCGTDGKTYGNECSLNCAIKTDKSLAKRNNGECQQPQPEPEVCICPLNYAPVCGTDGKTYGNDCSLNCAAKTNKSLAKKNNGECQQLKPEPEVCICPLNYAPVCGTDGKTYGNDCSLNCAIKTDKSLAKRNNGECQQLQPEPEVCICPLNYAPVCGTDGKTYGNDCSLNCAIKTDKSLAKKNNGECQQLQPEPEVCICPLNYAPVCGTDGKTYGNDCSLNCAAKTNKSLAKKNNGECQQPQPEPEVCICPLNYAPVCGTDGKTYGNDCSLNCAAKTNKSLAKKNNGKCQQAPATCACTFIWAPVCGSDGKTYGNNCDLNCAKNTNKALVKKNDGECAQEQVKVAENVIDEECEEESGEVIVVEQPEPVVVVDQPEPVVVVDQPEPVVVVDQPEPAPATPTCACTRELDRQCGSDGKTYNNKCLLECEAKTKTGLKIAYRGACQQSEPSKPTCACTRELDRQCGTDGKTYNNKCLLECEAKTKTGLKIAYRGACQQPEPTTPTCACTRELDRQCGTDGKTYNNKCLLECEAKTKTGLKIAYRGACQQPEPTTPTCACTRELDRQCGTDGKTYNNKCLLECEAKTKTGLKIAYRGACQQPEPTTPTCACTRELDRQCGTDGKTYNNKCLLECEAKTKTGLKIAYRGACQQPEPTTPTCACTRELDRQCGTDGKTYNNKCLLECEAKTKTGLKIAYRGACQQPQACACNRSRKQVCGTDGVTYYNECILNCEAANYKKDIKVKYVGPCDA